MAATMKRIWWLLLAVQLAAAADRQVAITIDDLPRGGDRGPTTPEALRAMTARLLKPFRDGKLPVTGFVNEGRVEALGPDGLRKILDLWLDAGADLGNHSYSHLNINDTPLEEYTADIVKGERVVREALAARGKTLRYYRHPFLFTGPTPEIKRGMQEFLDRHGYRVAPVTLDDSDYMYAVCTTSLGTATGSGGNMCRTWSRSSSSSRDGRWRWWGGRFRRSC
jgi:peptidoglycan/xylan/chitin deacetylase (PgdA/CDA1 family)